MRRTPRRCRISARAARLVPSITRSASRASRSTGSRGDRGDHRRARPGPPVHAPAGAVVPENTELSARWVLFHLIEEVARHAGHADIVRESVDGRTFYDLMAEAEGWGDGPWSQS
ncbi:MAG: DUF664 domain-containing protein [Streptosporangiales bacterium]|nr:DUF664 domain-containing protein [Streptosporangiales bacterium]